MVESAGAARSEHNVGQTFILLTERLAGRRKVRGVRGVWLHFRNRGWWFEARSLWPRFEGDVDPIRVVHVLSAAIIRNSASRVAASSHSQSSITASNNSRSMVGNAARTAAMASGRPSRSKANVGSL